MNPTTAHTAFSLHAQRSAVCVQALRMLHTTAQHWGMRVDSAAGGAVVTPAAAGRPDSKGSCAAQHARRLAW